MLCMGVSVSMDINNQNWGVPVYKHQSRKIPSHHRIPVCSRISVFMWIYCTLQLQCIQIMYSNYIQTPTIITAYYTRNLKYYIQNVQQTQYTSLGQQYRVLREIIHHTVQYTGTVNSIYSTYVYDEQDSRLILYCTVISVSVHTNSKR